MNTSDNQTPKFLTGIALFCVLIPASIFYLWLLAHGSADSHLLRQETFYGYFPGFIGPRSLHFIEVMFSGLALLLSIIAFRTSEAGWKALNAIIAIASTLLLLLKLWTLL